MDAFDAVIDEIAPVAARREAIEPLATNLPTPHASIAPVKARGKASGRVITQRKPPPPTIATPTKAKRGRAIAHTRTSGVLPGPTIPASESKPATRANNPVASEAIPPASKPSPKGARQARIVKTSSRVAPVSNSSPKGAQRVIRSVSTKDEPRAAKTPSQEGRKAKEDLTPIPIAPSASLPPDKTARRAIDGLSSTAPTPDATIPASAGANEAIDSAIPLGPSPHSRKSSRKRGEIGHTGIDIQKQNADLELSASNGGDAGHSGADAQTNYAGVESSAQADGGGHAKDGNRKHDAPAKPILARGDDAGHWPNATHHQVAGVVEQIVQLWRMRQRWHRAEKSLILQGKALCRSWTKGDKAKAGELFDAAADGKDVPLALVIALMPFLASIERFRPERATLEKELQKLAKSLPVWSWVVEQKGFGPLNLAAIVGESGDVGSYRNPSCLWKRMGLAVIGDIRQRRMSDADAAIAHGYNPSRRAVAYLLGECLIKGNGEGKYRTLYLVRKEIEAAREDVKTKAHAHNRSARYMTKRVLRDLWSAWRAA